MVSEEVVNLISTYLDAVKKEGIYITKAILFGSHAQGTAHEDSDIDLMLISPLFDQDIDKYVGKLWLLTKLSHFRIEPYPVGEKKFNDDDVSPIIDAARKEGIALSI